MNNTIDFWTYLQDAGFTKSESKLWNETELRILVDMFLTDILGM